MTDLKLDHALDVVRAVFGDTSVPASVTRERLVSIREEVSTLIDSIDESDGQEDEGILGDT